MVESVVALPFMTLDLASRVVAGPNQVSCDLGGEAAILHLTSGTYYSLNSTAAHVWTLLAKPVTVRAIHECLLTQYDVSTDRLERDLLALLGRLAGASLIEVQSEPAA